YCFHSGTTFEGGEIATSSGRALTVAALGQDIAKAKENAYRAVEKIHFEDMHYRTDIADRALK
ncbi:MAG: phosphoribosylamine--glycine ligase, partial [Candidatus Magnetominusculus sp. LBB02]|nr:phosphoribosylamine--glycine ligase [Candidatus Magnetominusculus sp. LBB02]